MMVLHYVVEFLFHMSRLLYFAEKPDAANIGCVVFVYLYEIEQWCVHTKKSETHTIDMHSTKNKDAVDCELILSVFQ